MTESLHSLALWEEHCSNHVKITSRLEQESHLFLTRDTNLYPPALPWNQGQRKRVWADFTETTEPASESRGWDRSISLQVKVLRGSCVGGMVQVCPRLWGQGMPNPEIHNSAVTNQQHKSARRSNKLAEKQNNFWWRHGQQSPETKHLLFTLSRKGRPGEDTADYLTTRWQQGETQQGTAKRSETTYNSWRRTTDHLYPCKDFQRYTKTHAKHLTIIFTPLDSRVQIRMTPGLN